MLRILSQKVSISIRKYEYAAILFDSAKFAPSVTRQPCVAYRVYIAGTYALTRLETGSQPSFPTRRCAIGDSCPNLVSGKGRSWHRTSADLDSGLDFGSCN